MTTNKNILAMCEEFTANTGVKMSFEIMHDNIVGIHVEGSEVVRNLAKWFFINAGYDVQRADLKEYKTRHPKANVSCIFGVYGNIF